MLRRLTWELRNREVGQTTCTEVCTLAGMRCTARPANIEACPQYDVQDGPDVIQRDLGDMARVGCASWSYNLRGYGLAVIDDCDREVNFTFQNRRDGARLNTIVCACDLQ